MNLRKAATWLVWAIIATVLIVFAVSAFGQTQQLTPQQISSFVGRYADGELTSATNAVTIRNIVNDLLTKAQLQALTTEAIESAAREVVAAHEAGTLTDVEVDALAALLTPEVAQ